MIADAIAIVILLFGFVGALSLGVHALTRGMFKP